MIKNLIVLCGNWHSRIDDLGDHCKAICKYCFTSSVEYKELDTSK